jgi:hypothetical protein
MIIPSSVICLDNSCFHDCKSLELVTFERGCIERLGESVFDGTRVDSSSVVISSGGGPLTVSPDYPFPTGSRQVILSGQEAILNGSCTLRDINRFIRVVCNLRAPFDDVSSAIGRIEEVVQAVVCCGDLGDRRFALLHKMQHGFSDLYPEIQSYVRNEMKRLNSGQDCYSRDSYAQLEQTIWNSMFDKNSGTFRPGMYDLQEIGVLIQVLGTRNFPLFLRDIVPHLRNRGLYEFIPPQIMKTAGPRRDNPDCAPDLGLRQAPTSGQAEIMEPISTLEDVTKFARIVDDGEAPFDDVSSAIRAIENVVQRIVRCTDLVDRRFTLLDRMQSRFSYFYPEVQSYIRNEMKELNSGHDCYDGDYYAQLGQKIWNSMYDESSGTFLPGMDDPAELGAVIGILGTRKFPLFLNDIVPPLWRLRLYAYIPRELLRKAEEENARALAALDQAQRTHRE